MKHGKGILKTSEWFYIGTFENDIQEGKAKVVY